MGWEYAAMPVLLFTVVAVGMATAMIVLGKLFGPSRTGSVKSMPYESGMDPIHDTKRRFDVRFHLVAIAFLVFDVELLFLYPWAVASKKPEPGPKAPAASVAQKAEEPESETDVTSVAATEHKSMPRGISASVEEGKISSRGLVFGGTMFFLALLTVGLVYDWRKGVFQWR